MPTKVEIVQMLQDIGAVPRGVSRMKKADLLDLLQAAQSIDVFPDVVQPPIPEGVTTLRQPNPYPLGGSRNIPIGGSVGRTPVGPGYGVESVAAGLEDIPLANARQPMNPLRVEPTGSELARRGGSELAAKGAPYRGAVPESRALARIPKGGALGFPTAARGGAAAAAKGVGSAAWKAFLKVAGPVGLAADAYFLADIAGQLGDDETHGGKLEARGALAAQLGQAMEPGLEDRRLGRVASEADILSNLSELGVEAELAMNMKSKQEVMAQAASVVRSSTHQRLLEAGLL